MSTSCEEGGWVWDCQISVYVFYEQPHKSFSVNSPAFWEPYRNLLSFRHVFGNPPVVLSESPPGVPCGNHLKVHCANLPEVLSRNLAKVLSRSPPRVPFGKPSVLMEFLSSFWDSFRSLEKIPRIISLIPDWTPISYFLFLRGINS